MQEQETPKTKRRPLRTLENVGGVFKHPEDVPRSRPKRTTKAPLREYDDIVTRQSSASPSTSRASSVEPTGVEDRSEVRTPEWGRKNLALLRRNTTSDSPSPRSSKETGLTPKLTNMWNRRFDPDAPSTSQQRDTDMMDTPSRNRLRRPSRKQLDYDDIVGGLVTGKKRRTNVINDGGTSEELDVEMDLREQDDALPLASNSAKDPNEEPSPRGSSHRRKRKKSLFTATSRIDKDERLRKRNERAKKKKERAKEFGRPKWSERSKVGRLAVACPYCLALHFKDEEMKCCDHGRVQLPEPREPPDLLRELLEGKTARARKHQPMISRINTLYSFASRSCKEERIGGYGVPITKIRGSIAHNVATVKDREGATPRFGSLYALDSIAEATEFRLKNERLSKDIDPELIEELGNMFTACNQYAQKWKFMKHVMEENNTVRYWRVLTMAQAKADPALNKKIEEDHSGRYNMPDATMAVAVYSIDDDGSPRLPNGLNIYPVFSGGVGNDIPFFSPVINSLCYPMIYPYGEVSFENSTIPLAEPKEASEEQMKAMEDEMKWKDPDEEQEITDRESEVSDYDENDKSEDFEESEESEHSEVEEASDGGDVVEFMNEDREEEGGNRVLRPTDDDALESDPPTDDEQEDQPVLPTAMKTVDVVDGSDPDESDEENGENETTPENNEPDSEIEEFEDGGNSSQDTAMEVNESSDLEDDVEATSLPRKGNTTKKKCVSHLQYLRYGLARRKHPKHGYHRIWSCVRLAQHYTIDNFLRVKAQRDWHIRKNFSQTLTSTKNAFVKSMNKSAKERGGRRVGMTVTVPASVKGSPAYMRKKYEDTMAMVCELGNPDLFITFTGNRKWPEIERYRKKGYTWADIADISVRVFMRKFRQLKDLMFKKNIFGKVIGYAYSIELQQRGMPHAHIILILDKKSKLDTPEKVDKHVWAHIPDPSGGRTKEEKKLLKRLKRKVEQHMIHTPCEGDPNSYCRKDQKKKMHRCSKGFPKEYSEVTEFVADGYVLPKRPRTSAQVTKKVTLDGGKTEDRYATNAHVVPYNPWLLLKFNCHINVEMCSTVKACKYIFKYIFKGFDKMLIEYFEQCRKSNGTSKGAPGAGPIIAGGGHVIFPKGAVVPKSKLDAIERDAQKRLRAAGVDLFDENNRKTLVYDETTIIESMRATTVSEALLGVYEIPIAMLNWTVQTLSVHEPGEETICWKKGKEEERVRGLQTSKPTSQLTAWFQLNQHDVSAREHTFLELPRHYAWSQQNKRWTKRKLNRKTISRIYPVMPRYAEKFAIRMLALHVRGPRSFEDLRTLADGTLCNTFTEAARARGLLDDEREWEFAMEEAVRSKMPRDVRRLYATIVAYCPVNDKQGLFDKFAEHMYDRLGATDEIKRARALHHIDSILKHNQMNNSVIGLEQPDPNALLWDSDATRREHDSSVHGITPEEAKVQARRMIDMMNEQQLAAFTTIIDAYKRKGAFAGRDRSRCFFLDGPGGTGKTFVYRAVYYTIIAYGGKPLMVAHTGIAATLLINGTTVHRQFCIPVGANKETKCGVAADSELEATLRDADVIIWDEAGMSDKRVLNAVEKFLSELEEGSQEEFGGKLMLLGGDWKQLLPVVRGTYGLAILDYTLKKSHLWKRFQILKLTQNMRLDEESQDYAQLLDLIGRADPSIHDEKTRVQLPEHLMALSEKEVIEWAFGGGQLRVEDADDIKDSAILTPLNDASLEINLKVLKMLPGETFVATSVDRCNKESRYMELPTEVYNSLTPMGLPPHQLYLKKGCIVMLLRNLNVPEGLCNGTRLRVLNIEEHLLECEIITGGKFEKSIVLLPRIEMEPSDQTDPSHCFSRRQFPVRLAYAMTINKAQGQSLKKVGVILRTPVFGHGQFYVAMSRATTEAGVKVFVPLEKDEEDIEYHDGIYNKVFREILD